MMLNFLSPKNQSTRDQKILQKSVIIFVYLIYTDKAHHQVGDFIFKMFA